MAAEAPAAESAAVEASAADAKAAEPPAGEAQAEEAPAAESPAVEAKAAEPPAAEAQAEEAKAPAAESPAAAAAARGEKAAEPPAADVQAEEVKAEEAPPVEGKMSAKMSAKRSEKGGEVAGPTVSFRHDEKGEVGMTMESSMMAGMSMSELGRSRAALHKDPVFFSGKDALAEVAKQNGLWNWALVGPDPDNLPISAGGLGSVEDMQDALGNYPCLFGLVRLTFSNDEGSRTKWVFLQASNMDDEDAEFSARQRGQALSKESKMAEVLKRFAGYSVKTVISSKDECTLTFVIETLQRVVSGFESELITQENYQHAAKKEKEKLKEDQPELAAIIEEQEEREQEAEELEPPPTEEPIFDLEPPEANEEAQTMRQRKSIKQPYQVGDQIEVWSVKHKKWLIDGEVAEFVGEACMKDNVKVRAGSMKVVYNNGKAFKWLLPTQLETMVQESLRPKPPARLVGQLHKETHNWLSEWHPRYFELNRGFFQWWVSEKDMQDKKKPQKYFSLLGCHMQEPQDAVTREQEARATDLILDLYQRRAPDKHREVKKILESAFGSRWEFYSRCCEQYGEMPVDIRAKMTVAQQEEAAQTTFKLKSDGTKGVFYSFDGKSVEETNKWVEAIWEHSEYCEELRELDRAKSQGKEVRRELLTSLSERRKSRKSLRAEKLQSAVLGSVAGQASS